MAIEALRDITRNSVSAFNTSSGGGGAGIAELDFGVNGSDMASVFLVLNDAGIQILTTAISVELRGMGTADHSYEEHYIEQMDVRAGNIVNGVGFEIMGVTRNVKLFGKYSVFWSWRN
jgi:hypothetical protein